MKPVKESLSFGQYLQAVRLEKKISLEEVSEETRIGLDILKLIEKEDHENLPAEVFVKGFLRAYARAIAADGEEAVRRYELRLNVVHKLDDSETGSGNSSPKLWRKLLLVAAVYFALIYLSILGMAYLEGYLSDQASSEKQASGERPHTSPSQSAQKQESDKASEKTYADKFVLRITAHEDTWLKIIIDNGDPREYELGSGDHLELEASSNFNLLIGNAGGVRIRLNDKSIPILAKSGEMLNLNLP